MGKGTGLSARHAQKGLALCAVYPALLRTAFESCEPEDVVYQLDYNEDGAARHSDEYFQLFRDCGWEFVQYFAGFSYFRKQHRQRADYVEGRDDQHG